MDPTRDSAWDTLTRYTTSQALLRHALAVEAAVRAYRGFAHKVPIKDGDYTMEHTALVYLMDRNGRFVSSFNLDRPPAQAAQELLRQL